jgi:hypothetical protein
VSMVKPSLGLSKDTSRSSRVPSILSAMVPDQDNSKIKIGPKNTMEIAILNDDDPGTFKFDKRGHFVKESCGKATVTVFRENGADGTVKVRNGFKEMCNVVNCEICVPGSTVIAVSSAASK